MSTSSLLRSVERHARALRQVVQQDLDVDFVVGAVHAAGVVDEVGVELAAAERVLDAAALRQAEVAAFADHSAAQLLAVDAHGVVGAVAHFGMRSRRWP